MRRGLLGGERKGIYSRQEALGAEEGHGGRWDPTAASAQANRSLLSIRRCHTFPKAPSPPSALRRGRIGAPKKRGKQLCSWLEGGGAGHDEGLPALAPAFAKLIGQLFYSKSTGSDGPYCTIRAAAAAAAAQTKQQGGKANLDRSVNWWVVRSFSFFSSCVCACSALLAPRVLSSNPLSVLNVFM